jgi:hypothetical protein
LTAASVSHNLRFLSTLLLRNINMIKIEITDPDKLTLAECSALECFFSKLADTAEAREHERSVMSQANENACLAILEGENAARMIPTALSPAHAESIVAAAHRVKPVQHIDPQDSPSTGAESEDDKLAREMAAAFGGASLGAPVPNVPVQVALAASVPVPVPGTDLAPPMPGVTVDAAGLPWDQRIHSSGKKTNKGDGLWTAKRGVEPSTIAQVEAELRALMSLPKPQAAVGIPVPIPQVQSGLSAPIPVPTPSGMTFAQLAPLVMSATAGGTITHAQVAAACQSVGLPNFPALHQRPDFIQTVHDILFPKAV